MKKRIYVDIHCLQTVPPSCVNRDDTGTPKTAIYGGVTRARVSSQSWKRAIRLSFADMMPDEELGVRTKKAVDLVTEAILKLDPSMELKKASSLAKKSLEKAGIKFSKTEGVSDALLFLSKKQATALAEYVIKNSENKDAKKEDYIHALYANPSIDTALFGRMIAGEQSLNYDAAAQVAHAISTHATPTQYDYFTAVDDLNNDQPGAGHIGIGEFNSSTLYRYATVNVMELYQSIGIEAIQATECFLKGFVRSMPSGKLNSYANWTTPCLIYVTVRQDQPVSLAGAFEKAIPASAEGYEISSKKRLKTKAKALYKGGVVSQPYAEYEYEEDREDSMSFKDILNGVVKDLETLLKPEEQ